MGDTHRVEAASDGQRMDKFIAGLPSVGSRKRARNAIESGKVLVDGRRVGAADRASVMRTGSVVTIEWNRPGTAQPARRGLRSMDRVGLRVVHEDEDILVVDKPAGLLTDSATYKQAREEHTVRKLVQEHLKIQGLRAHVVHRIDRDTSGLVVVARTEEAFEHLREQFSAHKPDRRYWVLVAGGPKEDAGDWVHPMRWDSKHRRQRPAQESDPRAVIARAEFRVLQRYGSRATALEVRLQTGRRNQIRLHCQLEGYSLVGERQYVDSNAGAAIRVAKVDRQALHAIHLGFRHPRTGRTVEFDSPLPPDLVALVGKLEG